MTTTTKRKPTPGIERIREIPATTRRLPAEWEPQDGLMLAWPHRKNGWKGDMPSIDHVFVQMVVASAKRQKVIIVCNDETIHAHAQALVEKAGANMANCLFHVVPTNDVWMRDTGPIGIYENGQLKLLDFDFNAWGGKYDFGEDDKINQRLDQQHTFNCDLQAIPMILEGGSIESNGKGTMMTTRNCLLTATRNASYSQKRIEELLKHHLGVDTIHWLKHGDIQGDDTDGHVDTLARFCPNDVIAYASCENKKDVNYPGLHAMEKELHALRQSDGSAYKLVAFPIPSPKYGLSRQRLACTYVNFMIINSAILCPQYNDANDELAISKLKEIFPSYEIVGINALPVVEQCGSFHCLCMQLTQGTLK